MRNDKQSQGIVKEAVGVFSDDQQLLEAIDDLETAHFARHEITIPGSERSMREALGYAYTDPKNLEDNSYVPRGTFISPEEEGLAEGVIIAIGMIVGALFVIPYIAEAPRPGDDLMIIVMGAIAGGLIGWLCGKYIEYRYNKRLQKFIAHGGIPLWVLTSDKTREAIACDILRQHGASDVHVHSMRMH